LIVNGTHNLVNADEFIVFVRSITQKISSYKIGVEVNANKSQHVVMSRDQNAGRSHNIKIESVGRYKYLGTNQNSILEEIKSALHSGNTVIQCTVFSLPVC
jgi:hypothetical protein